MWRLYAVMALAMWGVYSIPGNKATEVHGEKMTLLFETVAFVLLCALVSLRATGDFAKITAASAFNASVMGVLSAGGFYFMLSAMNASPRNLTTIVLIAGSYPAITAIVSHFLGQPLSLHQWVGVGTVMTGLALVNWK